MSDRTCYQILGVPQDVTIIELEAALARKRQEYDATKLDGFGELIISTARAETEKIDKAYQILSHADSRRVYDKQLAMGLRSSSEQSRPRETSTIEPQRLKRAALANKRAIKLWEHGATSGAIERWEVAIIEGFGTAEIYCNLGNAYVYCDRKDEAVEILQKAIELDPGLFEAYQKLGYLYYTQGNFDAAYDQWLQAFRIDPTSEEVISCLQELNSMRFNSEEVPEYQEGDETIIASEAKIEKRNEQSDKSDGTPSENSPDVDEEDEEKSEEADRQNKSGFLGFLGKIFKT